MPNGFHVERVDCCMCGASGRVPKLLFWSKDCSVCEGTGKRRILISESLSAADADMVRQSALYPSLNYYPAPHWLNPTIDGLF